MPVPSALPQEPVSEPASALSVQPLGDAVPVGVGVVVAVSEPVCEGVTDDDAPALSVGVAEGVGDADGHTSWRSVVASST